MLVPALIALAAFAIARERDDEPAVNQFPWLLAPLLLWISYIAAGSLIRIADRDAIFNNQLQWSVRSAAIIAVVVSVLLLARRPLRRKVLALPRWSPRAAIAFVALMAAIDLAQYSHWAMTRTYLNHGASIALRDWLPDGTLVHGKLANGLSLENRIRPVFVGREFGNYADRLTRTDVRYLLTYTEPRLGYEGPVILDVLEHLPDEKILATFPVQETPLVDTAALVDKFPQAARTDPR
jgi:hypothetical protein